MSVWAFGACVCGHPVLADDGYFECVSMADRAGEQWSTAGLQYDCHRSAPESSRRRWGNIISDGYILINVFVLSTLVISTKVDQYKELLFAVSTVNILTDAIHFCGVQSLCRPVSVPVSVSCSNVLLFRTAPALSPLDTTSSPGRGDATLVFSHLPRMFLYILLKVMIFLFFMPCK